MKWYHWKWWRLAWTNRNDQRKGRVRDVSGRWVRVYRGLYWRLGKRLIRRSLHRWAMKNCPHQEMKADVLEGDGPRAVAWCPDCGTIRIVNRDPSYGGIEERTPNSVTEVSQWK